MVRVIAGTARGRRLKVPKAKVRPTSDKVRGAIFDILFDVEDKTVLDVFAGTGALGIEALSRGATHATFVDHHTSVLQTMRDNIASCGFEDTATVVQANLANGFNVPEVAGPYDLILCDPPYEFAARAAVLADLGKILAKGGLLVVEHEATTSSLEAPPGLAATDHRRWGDTSATFFRSTADEGAT